MIEEKLELIVITYNRAPFLRRTLSQFAEGPFAACKLTVLDNCSSDETPEVCEAFANRFPSFRALRHRLNIGLSANYLRAVELSTSAYTWIICDDDIFDFSDCTDVLEAISHERPDLITLGSPGQASWQRGVWTTARAAARRGANYVGALTFVSGLIFRTSVFDSAAIVKGYRAAATAYPHLPFVAQTVRDDRVLYVSRRRIVTWDPRPSFDSLLQFWKLYVRACQSIEDRAFREQVIDEMFPSRLEWVRALARSVFQEKIHQRGDVASNLRDVYRGFSWRQRFLASPATLFLAVPNGLCRILQRRRRGADAVSADPALEAFRLS